MIEGGRLKMRLSPVLERTLLRISKIWGVTPEQAVREMIDADWEESDDSIPEPQTKRELIKS